MYTLASSDPADHSTIARLAPGKHSLRGASGLCIDLGKHARGVVSIVDAAGETVPEREWLPGLVEARGPIVRR
jgi:hypothetical protein